MSRAWASVPLLGCCLIAACTRSAEGGEATKAWSYAPPQSTSFNVRDVEALEAAWGARTADYVPRTRHLLPDGTPKFINRLYLESSPYLRQHAHNPVNWYPWGPEAFAAAKRLGRPVLLSVGYSTCHWCHVMEEESFEDPEIAAFLNANYIAIKVDREERPDVDAIYMTAVQILTRRGGWPMTVWLTPDREPFYGGTYFPPRDGVRGSRTGFLTLLTTLRDKYTADPAGVAQNASELARQIESMKSAPVRSAAPDERVLRDAFRTYARGFDATHGGLQRAPKFPSGLSIQFLFRYHRRSKDPQALSMAVLTLEKMAAGGMYDHVGGGFHRYSTDVRWLVPHFEKMLYDNALLTMVYVTAFRATGDANFRRVAEETLRYIQRDMTSSEGAFYSATDADSVGPGGEREEGWYFTWTPEELRRALPPEEAAAVEAYYAVSARGNFEGRTILNTPRAPEDVARQLSIPVSELLARVQRAKETLYAVRSERPQPLRDEKILTAWNGLMISALARAALIFGNPEYAARAEKAADFVVKNLRVNGRLLRSYKDGRARHMAYLEDYAFFIAGLLDLYEATGSVRWMREAIALDQVLDRNYAHPLGGYYQTASDHEKLLVRSMPVRDGAVPSGNSVQAMNLARLFAFTTQDEYRQRLMQLFEALGAVARRSPTSVSELLLAVDFHLDAAKEVVVVHPAGAQTPTDAFARAYANVFNPNAVLTQLNESDVEKVTTLLPVARGKMARHGKATVYVCEEGVCALPTTEVSEFRKQLGAVRPLGSP